MSEPTVHLKSLEDSWNSYGLARKRKIFQKLTRVHAEELFLALRPHDQFVLFDLINAEDRKSWLRLLAPDDAAHLVREFPAEKQDSLLSLLDENTRRDVQAILAYEDDLAGGLMNPRFVRLRPDITADMAVTYVRAQAASPAETINYAYVLDNEQKLIGAVSYRELLLASPSRPLAEFMTTDLVTIGENWNQEHVSQLFAANALQAIPVVDDQGRMKGIITVDDVVQVAQEAATSDMQKLGGSAALETPYLSASVGDMVKKRVGWLTLLFLGGLLTATAISYYEAQIEKAVVLALFIPLIISSGGNSGSQATSLIVRSLALGEVKLKDWWQVLLRELLAGLALGALLALLGWLRVTFWPEGDPALHEHYQRVALTVSVSLLGVVLWGNLAGSMLPFLLRRLGFDPATASAPFVATLVDVTGLVIYFTAASFFLGGILL